MEWGLQDDKVKPYKRIKARDLADGGYIIINEENLVSPKERDHLVGLVHGLEGGEIWTLWATQMSLHMELMRSNIESSKTKRQEVK